MKATLNDGYSFAQLTHIFVVNIKSLYHNFFDAKLYLRWEFYLYLYLSISITSSINLSLPDMRGALRGLIFFTGSLFIFNVLTFWTGYWGELSVFYFIKWMKIFYASALFPLAILIIVSVIIGCLSLPFYANREKK